jgi:GT2 family glycosyltransferase
MTIGKGSGKNASADRRLPKVRAPGSSPKRAEHSGATPSSDALLDDFDEVAYLAAFPDIAGAIAAGEFRSASHHYEFWGRYEDRLADPRYEALVLTDTAGFPAVAIDYVYGCKDGQYLVMGWVHDEQDPVRKLVLRNALGVRGSTTKFYRYRRKDVTDHLQVPEDRSLAFWAIVAIAGPETTSGLADVILSVGAERRTFKCPVRSVDEEKFRELALDHLGKTQAVGRPPVETFSYFDGGLGRLLIALNLKVSSRIALGGQTVHIGMASARPEASIIVCLLGKPELLTIQCALFSKCRGIENYEFIYVSNSPEMAELLIKDATIANRIYGMPITLILLPGNAGFGVANNVGAAAAHSDRLLIVNPDIFPMDPEWPLQHSRIVNDMPPEQVALFGVPLYYDDGSLMHGGMYFEVDVEFSFRDQQAARYEMLRVEHYGKGAPPQTKSFLVSRPVPAVTGAFMSIEREWFESLGGFSPEYLYGYYEDADLCLKSFTAGKPAWLHCLPFVHFEGKGSTSSPAHEGGRLVNRWHFTKVWGDIVSESIHGPAPQAFSTPTKH